MADITPARKLFDLLVSRDFDPEMLDSAGRPAADPAETEIFSFDFRAHSGKDYGTVVIMLGDDNGLEVYCADNVGRSMEGPDKNDWFAFLEQLKNFAVRNFMTFGIKNLNRLRYSMQGQAAIKEGLFESWTGNRTTSWNGAPTEARLMIRHKKAISEGDARYRYIESLFIETADSERYRLPFTSLTAGRAMLEHVRQGGRPYDARGNHISEMVTELAVLSRFRRANHGHVFEGDTQQLLEQVQQYQSNLQRSLKSLATRTGYTTYFESWSPADISEQDMVIESLKNLFVKQSIDTRIESALPLLAKIQQQGNEMKEANIFEAWANRLVEGTWSLPETPEQLNQLRQLLSQPLIVGVDAMDATEQLGGLVGDDELFDRLTDLADRDPNANAWDDSAVMDRMWELADASPELAAALTQIGTPTGPEDDQTDVAEGLAQDEAEEDSGWRAEFVNEINYNTFEVKVTNVRSKESANFIIRPVDMISMGPTLDIETMDVRDLQTGQTESWTKDDPAPDGPIANAIGSLFYDDKQLQKKLWNIVDTHDNKGLDMMPGLEKRRSIGQEVDADAYIDSGEKTQAAMAKMKKGMAEALGDLRPKLGSRRDWGKSIRKWRKARGMDESGVAEDSLNEFSKGEEGFGPFKIYIEKHFIDQFKTFDEAMEEVEFLRDSDPKSFHHNWRIVDGTGDTVWEYDIGDAIDAQRRKHKIQFNNPGRSSGLAEDSLNELSTDLLQRSAQVAKDKSKQAMDPKIHDALGGGYKNPLAKHYDSLSQKFDRGAEKAKQRDTVKTIASIASPAVMRKIGLAKPGVAESASFDLELSRLRELLGR